MVRCDLCGHSFLVHGGDDEKTVVRKACKHLMTVLWNLEKVEGVSCQLCNTYEFVRKELQANLSSDIYYDFINRLLSSEYDPSMSGIVDWSLNCDFVRRRGIAEKWCASGYAVFATSVSAFRQIIEQSMPMPPKREL